MLKTKLLILSSLLILEGCTSLAPTYLRPELPVPQHFSISHASLVENGVPLDAGWRTFFTDPQLKEMISLALDNNLDLKKAMLQVQEAAALYHVTDAERYPQINGALNASYSEEVKKETSLTRQYEAGIDVSYELDFFGKLKNMSESDRQKFLATKQAQRTAYIIVISQVAQHYFDYQRLHRQLAIANRALNNYQKSLQLIQHSYQSGKSNLLDLEQAKSLVEIAKNEIAKRQGDLALVKNALQLVIGNYNTLKLEETRVDAKIDSPQVQLPANLSSQILLQRPDIAEAEHQLIAANANIGVARAAFFPSISLTGGLTQTSDDLSQLFDISQGFWRFIPKITLPIFNGGKNKSNLTLAEIRNDLAILNYEKKIQIAFKEVSDALSLRDSLQQQRIIQQRYIDALSIAAEKANLLYFNGATDYLTVLATERDLFTAQQTMAELKYNSQLNEITLFIALGGGWIK